MGGAAASVSAPLLLGGLRRVLGLERRGSPVRVRWAAGVMGALVAGGLARRRLKSSHEEAGRVSAETPVDTEAMAPPEPAAEPPSEDDVAALLDWRRAVRRRRLAALEPRAATVSEPPGREGARSMERGPRRGPSGREQPWHEALATTSG
ncbi:hypothetical protein HPC49_06325 [Pyxidicoccus fallax]|uniref:Uncharacterized protein n=1 Tax=Pyxidicoccus fallax TaxID=394095 RepID=A0A848L7G7_9BACT|nr:hypothetical protein [Pyxidicoccus fallax]NPC77869.1 hypothetical protein [Pyxidicoccus fallax]